MAASSSTHKHTAQRAPAESEIVCVPYITQLKNAFGRAYATARNRFLKIISTEAFTEACSTENVDTVVQFTTAATNGQISTVILSLPVFVFTWDAMVKGWNSSGPAQYNINAITGMPEIISTGQWKALQNDFLTVCKKYFGKKFTEANIGPRSKHTLHTPFRLLLAWTTCRADPDKLAALLDKLIGTDERLMHALADRILKYKYSRKLHYRNSDLNNTLDTILQLAAIAAREPLTARNFEDIDDNTTLIRLGKVVTSKRKTVLQYLEEITRKAVEPNLAEGKKKKHKTKRNDGKKKKLITADAKINHRDTTPTRRTPLQERVNLNPDAMIRQPRFTQNSVSSTPAPIPASTSEKKSVPPNQQAGAGAPADRLRLTAGSVIKNLWNELRSSCSMPKLCRIKSDVLVPAADNLEINLLELLTIPIRKPITRTAQSAIPDNRKKKKPRTIPSESDDDSDSEPNSDSYMEF